MFVSISLKLMTIRFFDNIILLIFGKRKIVKEEFCGTKMLIEIWDFNVDNIIISKLIETKNNFKSSIGYLHKVKGPLILILLEMSQYVKIFIGIQ